ncbi:Serine/threonine protein kinase [Nannocystis exedens]|uniref:Serine/threonine protein kinase n=1 Tax=Nannocystis exedens TaxID=54 RepID=A0A1I1TV35_9BACT|nr:serine/threonine-protein kinase [Nannocystis exedens]PCC66446.1 Serine/threonine-protein kinase PknL [Nannocystis exedens]SFD59420.1 Serine/threonine protein kinase [Nannocystis exedens]
MSEASPDPASIGPFIVERKLGEGAMGVVFVGYDRKLERKVALKLVRRQLLGNPAVRERMIREAQAMARLSNPHVVQVYQVGDHDGGIYMAMEYVEGETLSEWLRSAPRPWQRILRTLCDAGRGLAAAHAAGLVHRDFKPDNVLVDAAGRARVLDFGLVQAEGSAEEQAERSTRAASLDHELAATAPGEPSRSTAPGTEPLDRSNLLHWSVRLTQMGNVLGTPAYMSPEQHFGRPAGPTSDQFSFSITLYEALYGVRPFAGDSWAAIRLQVQDGIIPSPPLESPVPRRLFKVIARGLALEPNDRWPSLAAMIAALEHDPWKVRVRVAAMAGLIGAASLASYAVAVSQVEGGQRCQFDADKLAGVWDQTRAAAMTRAFEATHLPFATDTAQRVQGRIDAYAKAWLGERQAACQDHAAGVQTDRLIDLRVACLERRKAHLATLVDVFIAADRAVVENAVQAAASLPSLGACADSSDLVATVPPDDPAVAERVEVVGRELGRVDILERTGQYEQGLALAKQLRAEAASLGYPPLEAQAALGEGRVLMASVRAAEAEAALRQALKLGIAHDLHATAAEAAIMRIFVLGNDLERPREALAAAPFAEALVERARGAGLLGPLLHNNTGAMHDLLGDVEAARASYEAAIAGLRGLAEPDPLEAIVHHNLGQMFLDRGRLEPARDQFVRARDRFVAIVGDGHPLVAHPLIGLGDVDLGRGRHFEAMPSYLRALALLEGAHGPEHRYLMYPLVGLGHAHAQAGRSEEAAKYYARAVQIAERADVHDKFLAEALAGLADVSAAANAAEQAQLLYERASTVYDALGTDDEKAVRAALRAGELALQRGDREAASRWFERVLAKQGEAAAGLRARAAAQLAAVLAGRGGAVSARVCELAQGAAAGLEEADPLRAETSKLAHRSCAAG